MKYYLIDYENVNAAGMEGIDRIESDSRVVIFYTKHSSKIDLGMFNILLNIKAELSVIEVHHGKQALDIQLASYLGFLVGTEGTESEYHIISKDKGYKNVQEFWSEQKIHVCSSIQQAVLGDYDTEVSEPAPQKTSSKPRKKAGSRKSVPRNAGSRDVAEKDATETGSHSAEQTSSPSTETADPAKAGESGRTGSQSSIKYGSSENLPMTVDSSAGSDASQNGSGSSGRSSNGSNDSSGPAGGNGNSQNGNGSGSNGRNGKKANELRNEVNTEIQKILSKAGYSGEIINATASFVSRNIGKDGYKQTIYRGIIKQHGQKTGLGIYRLIKGIL